MGSFAQALKRQHSTFFLEQQEEQRTSANNLTVQSALALAAKTTSLVLSLEELSLPENKMDNFGWHLLSAVVTQTVTYPARSIMNNAVNATNLSDTLKIAYPRLYCGVTANAGRGALVFATQTWMQQRIHQQYGEHSYRGKIVGILAPVAIGTVVANLIEMPIIQYNAGVALSWNVRPGSIAAAFVRELGFVMQLSPIGSSFLLNTGLTAFGQYHLVSHALDKNAQGWQAASPYNIGHGLEGKALRVAQAKVAVNMFAGRAIFLSAFSIMNRLMKETVVPEMQEVQKKLGCK